MTTVDEPSQSSELDEWPTPAQDLVQLLGTARLVTVANRLPCSWPPDDAHLVPTPGTGREMDG